MKPIDVILGMLTHAVRSCRHGETLAVVFAIVARVIEELPGDHSHVVQWIDSAIPQLKGPPSSQPHTSTSNTAASPSTTSTTPEISGSRSR